MVSTRIALVTGANQGVGFQVTKELVANDVTVLLGSRDLARGQAAAEQIGAGAIPIQIDITDAKSIAAAVKRTEDEFGRLDLLVNNASTSRARPRDRNSSKDPAAATKASTASLDEIRTVWETNVFGTLAVYQAMLPLLRRKRQRTPSRWR